MYNINDLIVYGRGDVCMVQNIAVPSFTEGNEKYYFLTPVNNPNSIIYAKVSNPPQAMRYIMSISQAQQLLAMLPDLEELYLPDDKLRDREFQNVISTGDAILCLRMMKGIYQNQAYRTQLGKKPNLSDERHLQKAEKYIFTEYSQIYEISYEEARDIIRNTLSQTASLLPIS